MGRNDNVTLLASASELYHAGSHVTYLVPENGLWSTELCVITSLMCSASSYTPPRTTTCALRDRDQSLSLCCLFSLLYCHTSAKKAAHLFPIHLPVLHHTIVLDTLISPRHHGISFKLLLLSYTLFWITDRSTRLGITSYTSSL
jgi:hypothetical protein